MRSLAVGAALAVVAAAAHGQLAEAVLQGSRHFSSLRAGDSASDATPTELVPLADEDKCLETINEWRKEVKDDLEDYTKITASQDLRDQTHFSKTDLGDFFSGKKCSVLKTGNFKHISGEDSNKIYVFSASRAEASRSAMTCADALEEWKKGFSAFKDTPPKYKDNAEDYADPNAAAIVGLVQEESQNIFCGTPKECGTDTIVCYIKQSPIEEGNEPVDAAIWHAVQEHFKTKPSLKKHGKEHNDCLTAVNEVRQAEGLDLPAFTALKEAGGSKARAKREVDHSDIYKTYEKALYELTCEDIDTATIKPAEAEGYTIIYATKEGNKAPTPAEAVAHWESGFEKLNYNLPPAFTDSTEDDEDEADVSTKAADSAAQIYDDSAVAGYVSLMSDKEHGMQCFDATGCANSALICILKEETLKDGKKPITEDTWKKIQKLKGFTKPTLEARGASENCIEEINAVRTQEALGLKPFTPIGEKKNTETEVVLSQLLNSVTCENLKAGKVKPVIKSNTSSSLLYYSGSENTCANAVDQWKKGFGKFSGVSVPPEYSEEAEIYQDGEATNFISLMSEGQNTKAKCYNATGCDEKGVVCELTPAVFTLNEKPISEATWKKIAQANGVAATFSSMAILTSAALAVAGVAFQL